jgi:hypothetical protein
MLHVPCMMQIQPILPTIHALRSNTIDAQYSFLRVSALPGCHHQGIFVVTQVVPLNWSSVYTTDAHQRSN